MEDRELSGVERDLRSYLSSQLDRLPVTSAPDFSRPRQSWIRTAAFVPAMLVVLLVAVGVGLGLADWRAHRVQPEESQVAASGAPPGPLALAGGAPSLGFGFVSTSANTMLIRNETTGAAPITITRALPQVAVSPNGHQIAYWRALPAGTGYELFRADTSVPQSIPGAAPLLRAPAGEVPGSLVWSSDGAGLVASTHTPVRSGLGSQPPAHASWFAIDLANSKVTEVAPAFASMVSIVHAWDRQRDLITGSGFYAGQNTFTALQGGRISNHAIAQGTMIAAADAYGRSVVLVSATSCVDVRTRCPVVEIHDQATFAIAATVSLGEPTTDFLDVTFRPRSQDLVVQIPLPNGKARVELWSDLGRGAHQVLATYSQSGRFTARREVILPRADGSGVFLLKFDDSAGGRWFGEVVGMNPLKGAAGFERTPFEILTGGNPLASIVLDPAFARAMDPRLGAAPPAAPPSSALPVCPGQTPLLDVAQTSPPGDQPGAGAANPEAAFNKAFPTIKDYRMYEFGTTNPYVAGLTPPNGPVWIVADGQTFVSLHVGAPGQNSWFAHPATFLGCRDARDLQPKSPTAACPGVIEAVLPSAGAGQLYPTRTASEVVSGLAKDPYLRHTLEDIAGVRQDSNPLRDSSVPRCAVDALTIGEPVFVRRYPTSAGSWYIPVLYQGRQVLIVTVGRNDAGMGASGGSIGGGGGSGGTFPAMSQAKAMQVAGTSTDPAVSAELVFARASSPELVAWRIVRASGSVYYVFPNYPGSGPDGLLLPESQVQFGS
jgi:hypothetical protein